MVDVRVFASASRCASGNVAFSANELFDSGVKTENGSVFKTVAASPLGASFFKYAISTRAIVFQIGIIVTVLAALLLGSPPSRVEPVVLRAIAEHWKNVWQTSATNCKRQLTRRTFLSATCSLSRRTWPMSCQGGRVWNGRPLVRFESLSVAPLRPVFFEENEC